MTRLPNTIYVHLESDGDDNFLVAASSLDDVAADCHNVLMGTYTLETIDRFTVTKQLFPVEKKENVQSQH